MYSYNRRQASVRARWVTGGERQKLMDEVWEMYKTSYAQIGMAIPGPQGLLRYEKWEVAFDGDTPVAFNVYRVTPAGLKAGALGTDGSPAGKSFIRGHIKNRFKRGNVFAEVSHAVERLSGGVPVVCAVHVPKVLGKPVEPQADGIHYRRNITGVGPAIKKLVGNPKGGLSRPEGQCAAPEHPGEKLYPRDVVTAAEDEDWMEAADHFGCQYEG